MKTEALGENIPRWTFFYLRLTCENPLKQIHCSQVRDLYYLDYLKPVVEEL